MVRRLPVIQNSAATPSGLGAGTATASLVVVAGFCWAVLLWGFAGFGFGTIAGTCFAACVASGAVVGSQTLIPKRTQAFAQASGGFSLIVSSVAFLGGTLATVPVFLAAFLAVSALSGAGFFAGGWFLTLRR